MKSFAPALLCLAACLATSCDEKTDGEKRAVAARRLEKTDCKAIAEKARRCRVRIGEAAEKHRASPDRERQMAFEMAARIHADVFSDEAKCRSNVSARVRYLRKDCRKYAGPSAVQTCRTVQRRYEDQLTILNQCAALPSCARFADCFVKRFATVAF